MTLVTEEQQREQRLQAAKKKLKTFRAKQAQAQAQRNSREAAPLTASQTKEAIANAVEDTIVKAAERANAERPAASAQSMPSSSSSTASWAMPPSSSPMPSHSRTTSRAGSHGRGHSRAGSISITADAMASNAAAAVFRQSIHAGQPPPSTSAASRPTSISASPSAAHSRRHSRSESRANIVRPPSIIGLGASSSATILAVERGPDSWGPSGQPADWVDNDEPLPAALLFGGSPSIPASSSSSPSLANRDTISSSHTRRQSRHVRKSSLATKRESMELMGGLGYPVSMEPPSSPFERKRASKRYSSRRQSGLQSASVLFGGRPESNRGDFDWRGAFQVKEGEEGTYDGEDRRTALEKLEGRSPQNETPAQMPAFSSGSRPSSFAASRRHSRQTSVQLPSFDDIHGLEGMDRRSSVNLLEANERSTSEDRALAASTLAAIPTSPWLSLPSPRMSSSQSTPELGGHKSPRPTSMYVSTDASQPEGLDTLVEEEEEDESSSSPANQRTSLDLIKGSSTAGAIEDEWTRSQRRESEEETIKRTRRASLQPRPLKLKSRPLSMYATPSLRKTDSTASSPTPLSEMAEETEPISATTPSEDAAATKTYIHQPGQLSRDWSMSSAQSRTKPSSGPLPASDDVAERRRAWRASMVQSSPIKESPVAEAEDEASAASPSVSRRVIRPLRLSTQINMDADTSRTSASEATQHSPSLSRSAKRASGIFGYASPSSAASSGSIDSSNSSVLPSASSSKSLRRGSLLYKSTSSNGDGGSMTPTQTTPPFAGVDIAVYEELKAKSLQDAELVVDLKKQVEQLSVEMASQAERASQEYSRLEQWSAEEKSSLTARLDEMETSLKQKDDAISERDASLKNVESRLTVLTAETQEQIEDLEAQRDMLQDDVDGWRTRCGDLQKSIKADKAAQEEERKATQALRLRVDALSKKLQDAGIQPPAGPSPEEASLLTALKSPAFGLDASTPSGSSYFSPHLAPSDPMPPPQAVQLLKDMRQQIFNLAGTLDHERKQHVESQRHMEEVEAENARLKEALDQQRQEQQSQQSQQDLKRRSDIVQTPTPTSADWQRHEEQARPVATTPSRPSPSRSSLGSSTRSTPTKRHVFAYDTSIDHSCTDYTMGSGATNMTSYSVEHQQPASGDEKLGNKILPSVLQPLPSVLRPLPSVLRPLKKAEDEASLPVSVSEESSFTDVATQVERVDAVIEELDHHDRSLSNLDLEAGQSREDDEEEDAEATVAEAVEAPRYSPSSRHSQLSMDPSSSYNTPALEPSATFANDATPRQGAETANVPVSGKTMSFDGLSAGRDSTRSSGSDSSIVGPASPLDTEAQLPSQEEQDEENWEDEEAKEQSILADPNRPEFVREWSYQEALRAVKSKKGSKQGPRALDTRTIEDFFGLLLCEQLEPLPPLPCTRQTLDMPPVYIEHDHAPAYSQVTRSMMGSRPPSAASARAAAVSGSSSARSPIGGSKRPPPVARSAFVRDSSVSSLGSGLTHESSGSSSGGGNSLLNYGSGAVSLMGGSRALSRVSLQGLTSAFSGLGGYLAGQSGAAVHAAAAATTMCSDIEEAGSRNPSLSWTVEQQQRHREDEDDEEATYGYGPGSYPHATAVQGGSALKTVGGAKGFKRFSQADHPVPAKGANNLQKPKAVPRRFISKYDVPIPQASPVWALDFSGSTSGGGGGLLVV